jgi:hypothetical protein
MSEQLKNVLWMSEELMNVPPERQEPAVKNIAAFLESAAGPELAHWIYPA